MTPALIPDALLSDPFYPRLKEHLLESTGLAYYHDKDADFARRIGYRLENLGLRDCRSYFELLRDPERGPAELDHLIAAITIGETHFFRHTEHFGALRHVILPELMRRNARSRRLRIWCAGCADGAEPYSLSILVRHDLRLHLEGWDVSILGTDINRRALVNAREATFEAWSLRSTPDEVRRECFQAHGKKWSLASHYRQGVSFQYHNLVETPFPSLLSNLCAFDLIVCRNVMIYFAPERMQRIVRQFHDCLLPGAWLLVGPAEPNMTYFTSFHVVNAPGVTLYRRPEQPLPDPVPAPKTSVSGSPARGPAPVHAPAVPALVKKRVEPTLAGVRCHLDRGDWEQAAACCEQLLKAENLNSSVHFHQAFALEQLSRHAEAERSLRRAIYLDRKSVLAHYYLGVLLMSQGDSRQAARSFENTVELLSSRRDDEVLADGGGIAAAELKKLARTQLELIREPV